MSATWDLALSSTWHTVGNFMNPTQRIVARDVGCHPCFHHITYSMKFYFLPSDYSTSHRSTGWSIDINRDESLLSMVEAGREDNVCWQNKLVIKRVLHVTTGDQEKVHPPTSEVLSSLISLLHLNYHWVLDGLLIDGGKRIVVPTSIRLEILDRLATSRHQEVQTSSTSG